MGEESHLDEMRSAIRGDFERLAERRGEQELMRVDAEPVLETVAREARSAEVESARPPEAKDRPPEKPRSWFARFVSP